MKEIKPEVKKWKDIPGPWIGRTDIVKIVILPKAIYRFNAIPIKIPMTFPTELELNNLKIHMEPQDTLNSQRNLEKKEQSWRYHLPDFGLY